MPPSEASLLCIHSALELMDGNDLVDATRTLARRASVIEADLISHLAEIDARKLYLDRAFPSMHAFCIRELGFSEDVAYNRIAVARAGRRFPALNQALRSGCLCLSGDVDRRADEQPGSTNRRTLESWEQGRARPNPQAALLISLVR